MKNNEQQKTDFAPIIADIKSFLNKHLENPNHNDLKNLKMILTNMLDRLETVHQMSNERAEYLKKYLQSRLSPEQLKHINAPVVIIKKSVVKRKRK